jgi:hypothetical protein
VYASSVSQVWVVPASRGSHTYSLVGWTHPATAVRFRNPTITALYVPFGASGSPTTLAKKGSIERPKGHPPVTTRDKKKARQR